MYLTARQSPAAHRARSRDRAHHNVSRILQQPNSRQRERYLAVLHEPTPDVAGTHVFGAEKNDAGVDTDDVSVDPTGFGVDGVNESVCAVDLLAVLLSHRAQRGGRERSTARRSTANTDSLTPSTP